MERDIWRVVVVALRRLPRRCARPQRYSNRDVLAMVLWAALHDRSILWACAREHWPMQAWRRRLPDQSTMSRRLRRADALDDLDTLPPWVRRLHRVRVWVAAKIALKSARIVRREAGVAYRPGGRG